VLGLGHLGDVAAVDPFLGLVRAELRADQHDRDVVTALVGQPDHPGDDPLGHRDRGRFHGRLRGVVQVSRIRSLELAPAREGERANLGRVEVGLTVRRRETADHRDLADLVRASVGGDPGQAARGGVPHHQGVSLGRVDGGEHRGPLVRERRRRVAVALARQGNRYGAVALALEFRRHLVPDRSVQPQARNQNDVHALTLGAIQDDRLPD
jgi:hypothetical protein